MPQAAWAALAPDPADKHLNLCQAEDAAWRV